MAGFHYELGGGGSSLVGVYVIPLKANMKGDAFLMGWNNRALAERTGRRVRVPQCRFTRGTSRSDGGELALLPAPQRRMSRAEKTCTDTPRDPPASADTSKARKLCSPHAVSSPPQFPRAPLRAVQPHRSVKPPRLTGSPESRRLHNPRGKRAPCVTNAPVLPLIISHTISQAPKRKLARRYPVFFSRQGVPAREQTSRD